MNRRNLAIKCFLILVFSLINLVCSDSDKTPAENEQQWRCIGPNGGSITDLDYASDGSGRLYVTNYRGGIFVYDFAEWTNIGLNTVLLDRITVDSRQQISIFVSGFNDYPRYPVLFRSSDNGKNWENVIPNDKYISNIVMDKIHSGTLYVSETRELYKSVNGGESWLASSAGLPNDEITSLQISDTHPEILFAGFKTNNNRSSIYKSLTAGQEWFDVGQNVITKDVTAIAINHGDADTVVVGLRQSSSIYLSVTGGNSWTMIDIPGLETVSDIEIDPLDPQIVYISSNENYWGTGSGSLFKSHDGALSFERVFSHVESISSIAITSSNPSILSVGISGGDGVYQSFDQGQSWQQVPDLNAVQTRDLVINPTNATTITCVDNKGILIHTAGSTTWKPSNDGLETTAIRAITIDPISPSTLYAGAVIGHWDYSCNLYKSTDFGESWFCILPDSDELDYYILRIAPSNPEIIYANRGYYSLYRSEDAGNTWHARSGVLNASLNDFAIERADSNVLYAGTGRGLYKSVNGGIEWSELGEETLGDKPIEAIALLPNSPTTLFAGTLDYGLFTSTDGGNSWTSADDGMNSKRIFSLSVDKNNESLVLAGTDDGIFQSSDAGSSWQHVGLHGFMITGIVSITRSSDVQEIWVRTSGQGIWHISRPL